MLREAKKAAASQSESWVTKNTKPCNNCGAPIQKNGGCNHITCSQCHGHFCWVIFNPVKDLFTSRCAVWLSQDALEGGAARAY